ncbi:hypothetical protein EPUS_01202 [Endocarpon pusillum Z07020]|uniref:Uncharacterized protein n=1 Tax=Endocarpon pusillum (strain Z07020 / HMAS-L-300199) TaxID=1263415 RepID=U1GUW2_ENDPU|nr:uncharacterized protein EPUS_01202 [Endocarpon pusillum Z07020]ERF75836.1 hypothetical protein EPUS_01202 [Endocarpon pusillum Z07020]
MSQRQQLSTGPQTSNIPQSTLYLQSSSMDTTEQLTDVEADYLFFCAYDAKGWEQENVDVNVPMFSNLLEVLGNTGAEKKTQRRYPYSRIKQVGVQWQRPQNSMDKSDPGPVIGP